MHVMVAGWLGTSAARAGGVTLITHGFNGNVTDWVIPMGEAMLNHPGFDGNDLTCYEMEVTSSGGGLQVLAFRVGGPAGDEVGSGEIVVKLDWSAVATSFGVSSSAVASIAAAALSNTTLIPELDGRAMAELPLHLVGHSRGGSVVTEIARSLGEKGIWVDQVTAMDPVPVGFPYFDAAVRSWENVLYMESYWQDIGGFLVPTGQPISGAYNRQLTSLSGGYSSPHSDAHLWYHGTIDLATPSSDTQATIGSSQRSSWWTAGENQGAATGFRYSRIGGGDRTSTFQPAGASAVRDGLNQFYDFGVTGSPNRQLLSSKTDVWPNLIIARRTTTGALAPGGELEVEIFYQDGASLVDPVLTVSLDPDRNPWNGNEIELENFSLPAAGAMGVLSATRSAMVAGVPAGSYAVAMTLSQGGKERHFHAAERVQIAPLEIVAGSTGLVGGLYTFEVAGPQGLEVNIEASDDLGSWEIIATQILGSGNWTFSDPDTGLYDRRFYRLAD